MEMNFWLTVSIDYAKNGPIFASLIRPRVCLNVTAAEISSKKEIVFNFGSHVVFLTKEVLPSLPTTEFLFFFSERYSQNVAARFALQTFVLALIIFPIYGLRHTLVLNRTFGDKRHLEYFFELIFEILQNHENIGQTWKNESFCCSKGILRT